MPTIDLGRKDECCPAIPDSGEEAAEPRIYYPSFSMSTDESVDIPEGDFEATVKLHTKGGEWSEDEEGNKKCTYRFDVMSITPSKAKKAKASEEEPEPDAAAAIMDSMKKARSKKMVADEAY